MDTLSIILITLCVVSSVFCVGAVLGAQYADRAMSKVFQDILKRHSDKLCEIMDSRLENLKQRDIERFKYRDN